MALFYAICYCCVYTSTTATSISTTLYNTTWTMCNLFPEPFTVSKTLNSNYICKAKSMRKVYTNEFLWSSLRKCSFWVSVAHSKIYSIVYSTHTHIILYQNNENWKYITPNWRKTRYVVMSVERARIENFTVPIIITNARLIYVCVRVYAIKYCGPVFHPDCFYNSVLLISSSFSWFAYLYIIYVNI